MSRNRLWFALGLLVFALLAAKVGTNIYSSSGLRARSDGGFVATIVNDEFVVESVFAGTPAAEAVRAGDRVTRFNGEEVTSAIAGIRRFVEMERTQPPGTPYTLTVRRDGETIDYALHTIEPPFVFSIFLRNLAYLLIPVVFFLTGLAVFLLKPFDKQATILALMFGTLAGVFGGGGEMLLPGDVPVWALRLMSFISIASFAFFPLFFHFFLIFPEPSPVARRLPRLARNIYAPYFLIVLPALLIVRFLPGERSGAAWQRAGLAAFVFIVIYCFACIIGGLVSLVMNYRSAGRLSRRKLRVVLTGSLSGFVPLLAVILAQFVTTWLDIRASVAPVMMWLGMAAWLCFLIFPVSFAYAIVRHQVIPIRVIIRRGVRYLLVARGSKILEMVAVAVALVFLLRVFFNYFETADVFWVAFVSSVVSIIVWNATAQLHHRLIAPVINRRFFRRAYNAQNLLAELGGYLRTTTNLHDITAQVAARLRDALQTENATVFLYDEVHDEYLCVVASQYVENECVTVGERKELKFAARDSAVVKRLRDATQPLAVDFDEPDSWAERLLASDGGRREAETLRCISAALLLPVTAKSGMLGIITVGARLGDLPFSREDEQMLMSVAYQMAFALENRQLVERRAEEERLRRELEMATEVQQRLFPASAPVMKTAELCGVCHPAEGVGGDYYDFIPLDAGRIGVAIADVAGKGISAALLMSTIQASLRSYAPIAASTDAEITDLISSMNSLLYASTASNSYATFFYAQYNEERRELTYVNAGHNPPLLVRAGGDELNARPPVAKNTMSARASSSSTATAIAEETNATAGREATWLTTGGMVIGIFDDCIYEQETIRLGAGDVLVAYTDGVTEALNADGEEFGGARLHESVIAHTDLPATEISARIISQLEAWTTGTTPHDDITLVVMKIGDR